MGRLVSIVFLAATACGPLVDDDGDASSSSSAASSSSSSSTSTSTTEPPEPGTTSTGEIPVAGVCQAACEEAVDCCRLFGDDPTCARQLGEFPYAYSCEAGVCRWNGCTRDAECDALAGFGTVCAPFGGVNQCMPACTGSSSCEDWAPGWACTGGGGQWCEPEPCVDDAACGGDLIRCDVDSGFCEAWCRVTEDCGGYGICDVTTGSCVCSRDDECRDGYTCASP